MTPPLRATGPGPGLSSTQVEAPTTDSNGLLPPRMGKDARSMSAVSLGPGPRGQSFAVSGPPPGSFSSELKSTISRTDTSRPELASHISFKEELGQGTSEQRQAVFKERIEKETKIKIGSENLLEALNSKNAKQTKDQRLRVESELNTSNRKIAQLKLDLEAEIQRSKEQPASPGSRLPHLFRPAPIRSPSRQAASIDESESDFESESPTFVLAEILQALEAEGRQPDYYIARANDLVELFKRHPTLKYDLAWSIFGLRMQTMLLSDSREVVAAGYRVMRYAITDRNSLQTIRALHTDYLVILALVKESKASVEREQAIKFIRAFLDVKDGVREISHAVVRVIISVAEHSDDRLRSICVLTLAEILIRAPSLLVESGGLSTLADALGDGNYHAPESLTSAFVNIMDVPSRRKLLRSGYELGLPFASFTEPPTSHLHEEKLKANAKVIAALFRSWPGIITLSMHDFVAVRSIVSALCITVAQSRNVLLELFFDILRIKPPSWSSSFLAGRRLTTYGRVTNMKTEGVTEPSQSEHEDRSGKRNLVEHFTAIILVVLLHAGLLQALLQAQKDAPNLASRRKTTLLLGEVLKLADQLLPSAWSADLQVLPDLFSTASKFVTEDRSEAVNAIYQVDSVNRTLYRSSASSALQGTNQSGTNDSTTPARPADTPKTQISTQVDEAQFRSLMLESQVLNSTNYTKWRWDLIQPMIEGPLLNPKRLDEAIKATKFIHRLCGFFRPFKYRFSDVKNTKPNQRYVRAGVALVRSLLQNPEGVKYLAENKMLRQVAECLAQLDRMSGIVSSSPLFSPERLAETLVGGYFAMLGALGSDPKGLQMMERWKIINMFYHIIELPGRDDLIRAMLSNLDFTLDSHPRIILSKAMTSCSKPIRIFSTRLLRKYAIHTVQTSEVGAAKTRSAEWAIRLLVTQLYDPEIEVCEIAIKILEEACNQTHHLEYVVKCRPALDHLGDIGAPLLLRFLSTSVGYHYLDGLDYISKEMDDWFLGRNDTYVALVEASLSRAFADIPEKTASSLDDAPEQQDYGVAPPHFYRELTRTAEGCKLLEQKGHFEEFASTIREFGLEDQDSEMILKVKGCLWAVGNVGSMELGAPFLEQTDVVRWIVKIAETSEVMTMRGTAVFVLGLISRSLHGQEILAEYHWDAKVNTMGESLGYCIPEDFQKLFSMKPWTASSRLSKTLPKGFPTKPVMTDADPLNAEILKLVTNLGNAVLSNRAAAELSSLKSRKIPGFQKPELFHKVMAILASHHYRLPVCRFVIDLFDKSVMRRIVLDEEDSDSDESETREGVGV